MRIFTGKHKLDRRIAVQFHIAKELVLHILGLKVKTLHYCLHKVRRRECLYFIHHGICTSETHHVGSGNTKITHSSILVTFVHENLCRTYKSARRTIKVECSHTKAEEDGNDVPPLVVPYHMPQVDQLDLRLFLLLQEIVVDIIFGHDLIVCVLLSDKVYDESCN